MRGSAGVHRSGAKMIFGLPFPLCWAEPAIGGGCGPRLTTPALSHCFVRIHWQLLLPSFLLGTVTHIPRLLFGPHCAPGETHAPVLAFAAHWAAWASRIGASACAIRIGAYIDSGISHGTRTASALSVSWALAFSVPAQACEPQSSTSPVKKAVATRIFRPFRTMLSQWAAPAGRNTTRASWEDQGTQPRMRRRVPATSRIANTSWRKRRWST